MSSRQIQSYLNRIKQNDPNKNFFIEIIIPSLKGTKNRQKETTYECPVCFQKLNNNCSVESKLFTTYYTFIRHLSEQHKENLPCNGLIFSSTSEQTKIDEKMFKCNVCNVNFGRKEHLNKHKLSIRHKENENKQNQVIGESEDDYVENEEISSDVIYISEENESSNESNQNHLCCKKKRKLSESSDSDFENSITRKKIKQESENIRNYLIQIEKESENKAIEDLIEVNCVADRFSEFDNNTVTESENEIRKENKLDCLELNWHINKSSKNLLKRSLEKTRYEEDSLNEKCYLNESGRKKYKVKEIVQTSPDENRETNEVDDDNQLLKLFDIYDI